MKQILLLLLLFFTIVPAAFSINSKTDSTSAVNYEIQNFNVQTEIDNYLSQLTPEQKEKSDSYFEGGYW